MFQWPERPCCRNSSFDTTRENSNLQVRCADVHRVTVDCWVEYTFGAFHSL